MRRTILAACAALALTGVAPVTAPQTDPRAAIAVSPAWLTAHLHDANLVLLHIGTGGHEEYLTGHIPGARYVEMSDLSVSHNPMMSRAPQTRALEMPPVEDLHQHLQALGISDNSRIVIYFVGDFSYATRIWLTMNYAGLGAATSVLDGGLAAWTAAGNKPTTDIAAVHEGKLAPLKLAPFVVTGDWVRDNATKPGYALIDARAAVFYDGVTEGGPQSARKKGHIPGAKSVPFTTPYTDKGELRPAAELRELFAKAGVNPGDTIVGYCHIGQQATAMLFAARSLGYHTVLYDGSFEDWALNGWPVEVPPGK